MPRRPPSPFDQILAEIGVALNNFADRMADHVERMTEQPARTLPIGERGRKPSSTKKKAPRQQKETSLYDILGVSPKADREVIAAAYKALAKKHHPDAGGKPEKMRMINVAWEVLKDPQKRSKYDLATRS